MTPAFAIYAGLLMARVGAFSAVAPPFSTRTPRIIRVGFALALAGFYFGTPQSGWTDDMFTRTVDVPPLKYGLALIREAIIGSAMGFAFSLFLLPARVAGEFLAQQVGLSGTPSAGPTGSDPAGPMTHAFETMIALLFLIADGHHMAIATLDALFIQAPLGNTVIPSPGPMIDGLSSATEMGLMLAGPLAACLFLLAVTMAVMARAAPQLNVYSVGFTLQMLVTLLGILFLLPDIAQTALAIIQHQGQTIPKIVVG